MTVRYDILYRLTLHTFSSVFNGDPLEGVINVALNRLPPWFAKSLVLENIDLRREGTVPVAFLDLINTSSITYDSINEQINFSFTFNDGTEFQVDDSIEIRLVPPVEVVDQGRGFDGPNFYPSTTGQTVDKLTHLVKYLFDNIGDPTVTPVPVPPPVIPDIPVIPSTPDVPVIPTIVPITITAYFISRNDYQSAEDIEDNLSRDLIGRSRSENGLAPTPVTVQLPTLAVNAYLMIQAAVDFDLSHQAPVVTGLYSGDSASGFNQIVSFRRIGELDNVIRRSFYVSDNLLLPSLGETNITVTYEL